MALAYRQFDRVVVHGHSVIAGALDPAGTPDPTFAALSPLKVMIDAKYTASSTVHVYSRGATTTTSSTRDLGRPSLWQNSGVGGWTTSDLIASTNIATKVTNFNPDLVLVACTLNDGFANVDVPGSFPPSLTLSNITTFISTIKGTLPNCRIGYISDLWLRSEQYPDGIGPYDAAVQAANASARTACINQGAEYIDIRARAWAAEVANNTPPPGAVSGIYTQNTGLGTHPNASGAGGGTPTRNGCSLISQLVYDSLVFP